MGRRPKTSLDWAFIMNGLAGLNDNGEAVFAVSNSALFMGSQVTQIRENFYVADLIETVIALPAGLFAPNTQIPTAILVINKNKERLVNKVRMINATSVPVTKSRAGVTLPEDSIKKIIEAYEGNDDVGRDSLNQSKQRISANRHPSLLPEQYVKDTTYKIEGGTVIEIDVEKWRATETV